MPSTPAVRPQSYAIALILLAILAGDAGLFGNLTLSGLSDRDWFLLAAIPLVAALHFIHARMRSRIFAMTLLLSLLGACAACSLAAAFIGHLYFLQAQPPWPPVVAGAAILAVLLMTLFALPERSTGAAALVLINFTLIYVLIAGQQSPDLPWSDVLVTPFITCFIAWVTLEAVKLGQGLRPRPFD